MDLRLSEWTKKDYNEFVGFLKSRADEQYRQFHSSLVPTAEDGCILGVRMPVLRQLGREISKGDCKGFLAVSSNAHYEERMLRGIVTGLIKTKGFDEFTALCDEFVFQIDNWAICDCFCAGLKEVKRYREEFFEYIVKYLESGNGFAKRAGLVIMLDYYLDDAHIDEVLARCDRINSGEYYVCTAQAWLAATALARCRDKTMKYLHCNSLNDFTFNKAVQKCVESRRIDDKTKAYLKTLKASRAGES